MPRIAQHQQTIMDVFFDDSLMSIKEIVSATLLNRKQASSAASKLVDRGLLKRQKIGRYKLTEAGDAHKRSKKQIKPGPIKQSPKQRSSKFSFQGRLWHALTLHPDKKVTVEDLLEIAATDDDKNPEDAAYRYLRALVGAGFVEKLLRKKRGDSPTSNGVNRYLLMRTESIRAPISRRPKKTVYDPNTGIEYSTLTGQPVTAGTTYTPAIPTGGTP